ncbi:MAG: DUF4380 domain-containing protein [Syntrophothermus sp.]
MKINESGSAETVITGSRKNQKINGAVCRNKDGFYSVTSGINSIVIDPQAGGRIVSFKNCEFEFLTDKTVNENNYGSTFWPSPQSFWNWPPPAVLDNKPYEAAASGKVVSLVSGTDPVTGLKFMKEFSAGDNNSINIIYTIINASAKPVNTAPWEITRVRKGGLLFFPIGDDNMRGKQFEMADYHIISEILWYKDSPVKPEKHKLNIADGLEGWMAYAAGGKIFVKSFPDVKPEAQAPGEAEVLFYVSPEADYIEIEVQGTYKEIQPSESSSWHMKWTGADIPPGTGVVPGSTKLVEFVRNMTI